MRPRVVSPHRNGADSLPVLQIPLLEPSKIKRRKKSVKERFNSKYKVNPETGCWEWTDYHGGQGYGKMRVNGKFLIASRISYMLFKGAIPEGLVIDHLCRVRHCVNPDHLEAISNYENTVTRGVNPLANNARKTHCKRGHKFTKENTYMFSPRSGLPKTGRQCISCRKERQSEVRHLRQQTKRSHRPLRN